MTLTKPYEATFYVGDNSTKTFSFLFDEVSENFIKVVVKRIDGTIYTPIFSVDMELKQVVFGEDEITPTAEDVICIYRETPAIQDTKFNTLQGYNAKALENILSKIVAMIQEMKANGFGTQVLQGEPWSLDLIKPADDGASVQIDYEARVLKKGLYFKMSDGNLQASVNGIDYVTMPKSENIAEFRQREDAKGNVIFEYRVGNNWYGLATSAEIANVYSKEEIDNKITIINAEIDANAEAIAKTRNDYEVADQAIRDDMNAEDSRLQTQITAQATAITTNKNDIDELGDDVAEIQAKIPESASGTNPLITKQQLLDEEMDIRDDMNQTDSELQTQITAQAAEIATKQDKLIAGDNIIISGNVITATGAGGGAGFDVIIVQELPAEGQKGIIYLVAKDSEAPDIYDEYIWVTATQTFEFIGTTQVDLSDYAKKEYVDNAISGFEALPDQADNAGKFLTTDGTAASWSDKPLVNRTTKSGTQSMIVGDSTMDNGYSRNVLFGFNTRSYAAGNVRFGFAGMDFGSYNFSFGHYHETQSGIYGTINLGWACKPTESQTLNVCFAGSNGSAGKTETYTLLSANGTIPAGRMSAVAGTTGQVLTKTDAGMEWQEASGGTTITLKEYDE